MHSKPVYRPLLWIQHWKIVAYNLWQTFVLKHSIKNKQNPSISQLRFPKLRLNLKSVPYSFKDIGDMLVESMYPEPWVILLLRLPLTLYRWGGGSGGGHAKGGNLRKGREERKKEAWTGLLHRSSTCRLVGWDEQEKRWEGIWREPLGQKPLQWGQMSSWALPTLFK